MENAAGCPECWTARAAHDRPSSEDDCLKLIDRFFPRDGAHIALGRGDDCAELRMPGAVALSTDAFMEGSHFRREYFTPEEAGAKALATAVSDLAGAGAEPLGFSLGLLLPPDLPASALEGIFSGMAGVAGRCGIPLTGGDISRSDRLGFCLTVWGASAGKGAPFLRRAQAEPGDVIFLIGSSGLAHAGLLSLEDMGRKALARYPHACAAHLAPAPLLAEGAALAEARRESGCRLGLMDLSDGLVRDLPRLLGDLGADLDPDPDLLHPELRAVAERYGRDAEEIFLLGGEDYALVGTCAQDAFPLVLRAAPRAVRLGAVRSEAGLLVRGKSLFLKGFDHLAGDGSGAELDAVVRKAAGRLIRLCGDAWRAGLLPGFSGNASMRAALPGGGEGCLVTRSGAAKGALSASDFALLDVPDGRLLRGAKPSSEAGLHLALYRVRPETRIILHTHPPYLSALSLALSPEKRLRVPLFESAVYREKLAWVPDLPPGTDDLAEAAALLAERPALWLERHGLCVHGADPAECLALTEELEHLAHVQLLMLRALT